MSGEENLESGGRDLEPAVYSSLNQKHSPSPSSEEGHVMSERVQTLASRIYSEFENMIRKYDEEVVKELMPLIVSALEGLDKAIGDKSKIDVEMELLREDNQQLLVQFEREKQLRKAADERLMLVEDSWTDERTKLAEEKESLQSTCKMLELKARNSQDLSIRLEEKERELKRDLHHAKEKYNELLRSHSDYVERSKLLMSNDNRPVSVEFVTTGSTAGTAGGKPFGSQLHRPMSQPPLGDKLQLQQHQQQQQRLSNELSNEGGGIAASQQQQQLQQRASDSDCSLRQELAMSVQQGAPANFNDGMQQQQQQQQLHSAELDDIDVMQQDEQGFTVPIAGAADNQQQMLNDNSIFEDTATGIDMGNDIIGNEFDPNDLMDDEFEGSGEFASADGMFGMSREIENLIKENTDLTETKNALNIVKDDLIAKVDELTHYCQCINE